MKFRKNKSIRFEGQKKITPAFSQENKKRNNAIKKGITLKPVSFVKVESKNKNNEI